DDRSVPLLVADVQLAADRAGDAEERAAVLEADRLGDVVRVDGEARLRDVAVDRRIVAVDEVGEVRADAAALAVDRVALRTAADRPGEVTLGNVFDVNMTVTASGGKSWSSRDPG